MTRSLDQALLQGADVSAMASMNLLVNGFHTVSQQNGSTATATVAGGVYATDQWVVINAGSWSGTFQQVQNPFPSQPDIPNGLKLSITTAEAALAAGDYVMLTQPLEGTNLARLNYGSANAKPVTLAFVIRPSIAFTGHVRLATENSSAATIRSFVTRFTAPANTDTFVCLTIPGDQVQALLTSNIYSLAVQWCFGTGTTYQGATGVWSGNNVLGGADQTNLAATVGNSVILSGAVMLTGIVPISQSMLPLLARQYDDELRKCRRYFYKWNGLVYPPDFAKGGFGNLIWTYPVTMRVVPTITTDLTVQSGTAGVGYGQFNTNNPDGFSLRSDTTGAGSYASITNIVANARM